MAEGLFLVGGSTVSCAEIAREKGLNIFISVYDIINIQMDEFNECLDQYKAGVPVRSLLGVPDLSKTQVVQDPETGESRAKMTEAQAVLAREIRRRGRNTMAAEDRGNRANERISHLRQDIERVRERSRVDVDPFAALEMVARLEEQLEQEIQRVERLDDSDDSDEDEDEDDEDEEDWEVVQSDGSVENPNIGYKDQKIAREKGLNTFISVYDIINIQMDEFNECLQQYKGGVPLSELWGAPTDNNQIVQDPETGESKAKMTEEQAVLAREIRRRGKNKIAAQDCRKRANERICSY